MGFWGSSQICYNMFMFKKLIMILLFIVSFIPIKNLFALDSKLIVVAPLSGSIVYTGGTVTANIKIPNNIVLEHGITFVSLLGYNNLDFKKPPYDIKFKIPDDFALGTSSFIFLAQEAGSAEVILDTETLSKIKSIGLNIEGFSYSLKKPVSLSLANEYDSKKRFDLIGLFFDGKKRNILFSSKTKYVLQDESIASIKVVNNNNSEKFAYIVGKKEGRTKLKVSYGKFTLSIPIEVKP